MYTEIKEIKVYHFDGNARSRILETYLNKGFRQKNCYLQNDVTDIHDKRVIADENNLRKTSNDHYMNIVEKSYEVKPKCTSSELAFLLKAGGKVYMRDGFWSTRRISNKSKVRCQKGLNEVLKRRVHDLL